MISLSRLSPESFCNRAGRSLTLFMQPLGEGEGLYQLCRVTWSEGVWRIDNLAPPIKSLTMPDCWKPEVNQ
jgi:hypothetical protein